jgi:hypothetical protein
MTTSAKSTTSATLSAADREHRFASRVIAVLDQSLKTMPGSTVERLVQARKAALRAHKPQTRGVPVWNTGMAAAGVRGGASGWFAQGWGRAGFIASTLLVVCACLAGLYQFEQQKRIEDLADVDMAVLGDDVPISDYADHGFNAFLKQNP